MPSTMPLRIGDELLSSARVAAEATGRSAAQQIGYWAKLGRELERSGTVSVRAVAEVLAGARAYDDLDPKAQALVRAEWSERIDASLAALDLGADFAAEGQSWVELAPDGATIRHAAPGAAPTRKAPTARKRAPRKQPAAKATTSAGKKVAAKEAGARTAALGRPAKPTSTKASPTTGTVKKKASARTR